MEFIHQWGYLIAGLVLLVVSGDFLVRGSVAIANRYRLSPMVVGMTIVAFGTSAPELIVSLNAAVSGHPQIALGNVIGSNIANIALVLGLTAIIIRLPVQSTHLQRDWRFMMFVSILFVLFFYTGSTIARWEGILFVALLIGYIVFSIKKGDTAEEEEEQHSSSKMWISIAMIIGASAGLAFGADLLVKGASNIASKMGVSERIISITIVAFGTSLPELVTSVLSAIRKQMDISIGNIVGSNLFNILAVIGLTSTISPIKDNFVNFQYDMIWMLLIGFILMKLVVPYRMFNKSNGLNRVGGTILLSAYIVYVYSLF